MDEKARGTVEFNRVCKRYRLGSLGTLHATVGALFSRDGDEHDWGREVWAVRDVSFCVEPGDALGLIGPNGAGKTTTLKLLSNITQPTSGSITIRGRTASLIELGAGFHPELTGRENIFLNGAILGLKRREIQSKLDRIIGFSGLERFIDTPVKRYSSGMYVRLGFAVAAHVAADVLLIDEVLAVGDAEFRRRCTERMQELRNGGTTLLFVSHNMYQVRRLCDRALLLINGEPAFLGETSQAIAAYERSFYTQVAAGADTGLAQAEGQPTVILSDLVLLDSQGQPVEQLRCDEPLTLRIAYRAFQPIVQPVVRVRLLRSDNTVCAMTASAYQSGMAWTLDGEGVITARFDPIQLASGRYLVDLRVLDSMDSMLLTAGQSSWFDVLDTSFGHEKQRGIFVPNLHWSHESGIHGPGGKGQDEPVGAGTYEVHES